MKHRLRYYGDPILRQKCEPVGEITDEILGLISEMEELMEEHRGIGIAAPQVGVPLRLFVSILDCEDENGDLHYFDKPIVYINPILTNPSAAMVDVSEGCLSIPKLSAAVLRPNEIDIKALDRDGKTFTKHTTGYLARHVMHENDHLNGVLYVDRIKGKRRTELEPHLRKIKQFYKHR